LLDLGLEDEVLHDDLLSGSVALANARTARPVIVSTVATN
jgi:hypothetical protein